MKPITEADQLERLKRAIVAFEGIGYMMLDDVELMEHERFSKMASDVYCIAHSAAMDCKADHSDWLKRIEEIEKWLKDNNFTDPEKHLPRSEAE